MSKSPAVDWAFDTITKVMPYDPAWSDGAGNFDGIVYGDNAPLVKPGEIFKISWGTGLLKKAIVIGTYFGNVAIFETKNGDYRIYAKDAFFNNGCWFERGIMTEGDLELLVGKNHNDITKNIGWVCREVYIAGQRFIKEHAPASQ